MDRNFPALFSGNYKDGATLRSAQVLKQEAEDIGFEGKDILEYVKEQQKLDREERQRGEKIGREQTSQKRKRELMRSRFRLLRLRLRKNKPK